MKLENQVCTAASGKRLTELGIDGTLSYWKWRQSMYEIEGDVNDGVWQLSNSYTAQGHPQYPAFGAEEMLVMLQKMGGSGGIDFYALGHYYYRVGQSNSAFTTFTEAVSDKLIDCLECKWILPEDCNELLRNA